MDKSRFIIPHVAIGIDITGLEDHFAVSIRYSDAELNQPLAGEPGWGVVPLSYVGNLCVDFDAAAIRLDRLHITQQIAVAQDFQPQGADVCQTLQLIVNDFPPVIAGIDRAPSFGEDCPRRNFILEFIRAPTRFYVKRQPFRQRRQLLPFRVVGKDAGTLQFNSAGVRSGWFVSITK